MMGRQLILSEYLLLFQLSGVATYTSGKEAEKKIDIRIKVLDENDNAPVFGFIKPGEVKELSPAGKCTISPVLLCTAIFPPLTFTFGLLHI